MKLLESQHAFAHAWEAVTQASWRKYPNPLSPQVVSVDVLDQHVDPSTGRLHTTRLLGVCSGLPGWLRPILGDNSCHGLVYEQSVVDVRPSERFMELRSRNVNLSNFLAVEEVCRYDPHPTNPQQTVFTQWACVTVRPGPAACARACACARPARPLTRTTGCDVRQVFAGFDALRSRMEQFMVDRMSATANRGREALESVLQVITTEAVNDSQGT